MQRRQSFAQEQRIDFQFLEYNEQDIAQRQEHVLQIESDAREVMEMYADMQQLVGEQQESIDVIENNITSTRAQTESAMKELLTAEEYQRSARKKQCCMALVVAVVIGVFVIIYAAS